MTVSATIRRAGPYIGNGSTTEFSFAFKVFNESEVYVARASDDSNEVRLELNVDYTVTLNADQDNSPGGTVKLKAALPEGHRLSLISDVPYDQKTQFTNKGGFYPETLNLVNDKTVALTQQLLEKVDRAITTDATDTMTAQELKQKLLSAAESAFEVANAKAEEAKAHAQAAAASAAEAATTAATIDERTQAGIERINSELASEGDAQIERIRAEADNTLIQTGTSCGEATWELESDTPAGTDIVIPTGLQYLVNRKHLRVSWNGCVLYREKNFVEVGDADTFSKTIRLTFDAQAGDELNVWVGALGAGSVAEAIATANAASDAVAELSRKVVYKDEASAS